jgi:hypothetical protein
MSKWRRGHTALYSDVGDMLKQNGGVEGEKRGSRILRLETSIIAAFLIVEIVRETEMIESP